MKELIILGASGSIGSQTLDIVREFSDKFRVIGLSVGRDLEKARKIIEELKDSKLSNEDNDSFQYAETDLSWLNNI